MSGRDLKKDILGYYAGLVRIERDHAESLRYHLQRFEGKLAEHLYPIELNTNEVRTCVEVDEKPKDPNPQPEQPKPAPRRQRRKASKTASRKTGKRRN